jgi:hypothetical protein
MNDFLITLITHGLWSLPYLCIWAVGFGICVNFHAKNKLAANLAIAAFSILIVNLIISILVQTWLITFRDEVTSAVSLGTAYAIAGGINTLLSVIGWVILLIAIYQLLIDQSLQPKQTD